MPQFDIDAARQSGATDDQILSYVAQRSPNFDVQGALKAASKQDVISYLASHSAPPVGSAPQRPDFSKNPPGMPAAPNAIERQELQNPSSPNFAGDMPGSTEGHGMAQGLSDYGSASGGQMYRGLLDIAHGNVARGGHEAISGAGNAMLPAAPFVLPAGVTLAPMSTLLTVGGGVAGQYGGEKAATALGATPDQAQLVGDVASLAAGYGAGKTGSLVDRAVSRMQAPLGDLVNKPRGSVAAESATPAELKAYADQNGIPLTAAQATEHNLPRNIQSAGERASVGGTAVRQQIKASQAAVAQHTQDLMQSFSPRTPDLATVGDTIQSNVEQALAREQLASRQDYAAIDKQAGNVTVNLQPLKQTAQRILSDSDFVRKVGALDPKRASAILEDIADLPNNGSFSEAQQLRSALLDASRTPELAISNQAQAWIKQLTGSVDTEMMTAAKSQRGLETAFRNANARWEQLQNDFNNPRSPLAQILQEPDPSKVPQKLTQRGQIGGSPYNAQLLDRYGIDKGPIKWAITADLFQKNFGLYNGGKTLGGYSDDFLRSVFTPQELDHIYKTGAIARSVGLNTNPSGTAAVSGAMADVQSPIRSLAPKSIAAKLTTSPAFNRRMMTPGVPGRAGTVPLSALIGAARSVWQPGQE